MLWVINDHPPQKLCAELSDIQLLKICRTEEGSVWLIARSEFDFSDKKAITKAIELIALRSVRTTIPQEPSWDPRDKCIYYQLL